VKSIIQQYHTSLEELKFQGLYRRPILWSGEQKARGKVEGRPVLLMCSNNYLGLASDFRLKDAAIHATRLYGTGACASRLISGTMEPHQELEEKIAKFKQAEQALLFSTGYMANIGILQGLVGEGDVILSDTLNHASIIDGCRFSRAAIKVYRHRDTSHLEELLKSCQHYRQRLIVTDGVFSMDGDMAPLVEIVGLAKKYGALTVVDDAHGTGVLGKHGKGTAEHFNVMSDIDLHMGTLGKALGVFGAYVAGSKILIETLINRARSFIFTTALPPSIAATASVALDIVEKESERRERLNANAHYFREGLKGLGFNTMESTTQIIPIFIGDAETTIVMSRRLLEEGIFIQGIRPPTVPSGMCRLRTTVMATMSRDDLDFALEVIGRVGREMGIV